MTVNELKKDLRQMRFSQKLDEALFKSQKLFELEIEKLSQAPVSQSNKEKIVALTALYNSLDIPCSIFKNIQKRERYLKAIKLLDDIDQYILVEAFINHEPYYKIANAIHYSEDYVRKKATNALTTVCEILDKFKLTID